jgi:hypothetical protein
MFGFQHKKIKLLGVWILFFPFQTNMKKIPIICFFLLDPRVKTFYLVSSLIGHEQGKAIAKEYDSF